MSAPSSEESVSLLEEYQHYSEVQYESVSNFDKGLRNKEQVPYIRDLLTFWVPISYFWVPILKIVFFSLKGAVEVDMKNFYFESFRLKMAA